MSADSDRISARVAAWYKAMGVENPVVWKPQGKTAEWPDRVLLDQGDLIDGRDVLNLGCFYPEDELEFAHRAHSWWAIDLVSEVVEACIKLIPRWEPTTHFMTADMRALPFDSGMFDVVTDFSSGDHLTEEDWIRTIKEAYRVLRADGHFLVCFANRDAYVRLEGPQWRKRPAQEGDYGYVRTNTFDEMTTMLEENGFLVVRRSHDNDLQMRGGVLAVKRGRPIKMPNGQVVRVV